MTASSQRTIAILGYHKVGPAPAGGNTWFYVDEHRFMRHLDYLRESQWPPLDCATLIRGLAAPDLLPRKSVMITFDDGYRSNLTVAAPHLVAAGFPATVFVATNFIGGLNDFDRGTEPPEQMCTWDDLAGLLAHGIAVQSHGMSHTRFSDLTAVEIERELRDSRTTLEGRLGQPVELLSFPFGDAGGDKAETCAILARNGYRGACSYAEDTVNLLPGTNPFLMARFAIGSDTNLAVLLESAGAVTEPHT